MGLARSVGKSAGNGLQVVVALSGAVVTGDFLWFFGLIFAVGVINFILGIQDDRKLRTAELASREDRTNLAEMKAHVEETKLSMIGMERSIQALMDARVPKHLEDLSRASATDLKVAVSEVAAMLRLFESEQRRARNLPMFERMRRRGMTKVEHIELFTRENEELTRLREEGDLKFLQTLRPGLLALWEEVVRRSPPEMAPERVPIAIKYGTLGGASPLDEAASELERLARAL